LQTSVFPLACRKRAKATLYSKLVVNIVTSVFVLAYRKRENHNHKQGGQNSTRSPRICLINHATPQRIKKRPQQKTDTEKNATAGPGVCRINLATEGKKNVRKKMLQRQCAESTSLLERKKTSTRGGKKHPPKLGSIVRGKKITQKLGSELLPDKENEDSKRTKKTPDAPRGCFTDI
jgi:hypothetical protein